MMKLLRLFPSPGEIQRNLRATLPFLLFRLDADEGVDPSVAGAWRSFTVWWILVPYAFLTSLVGDHIYLVAYKVPAWLYYTYFLLTLPLAVVIGLMGAYWLAKLEKTEAKFPRFITAANWFALWGVVISFVPWLLRAYELAPPAVLTNIDNSLFILSLAYLWFIGWRVFRMDPFMAIGVAVAVSMPGTVLQDYIGLRLFGVARPFFEIYAQ